MEDPAKLVETGPCLREVGFSQLPKADLLTFWLLLFGLVLVIAPKG